MAANYPYFYPIIYHDINLEIPAPFRSLCYRFYRTWQIGICIGMIIDFVAALVVVAQIKDFGVLVGLHIVHLIFLPVILFILQYWPLYKALKRNSSIAWTIFWVTQIALLLWIIIMISGVWPGTMSWAIIYNYSKSSSLGALVFANIVDKVYWAILGLWYAVLTRQAYWIHRFEVNNVHQMQAKTTVTELKEVKTVPSSRPNWNLPTQKVAGQDVNVSVDAKVAASVASKAVTSGAAGQLARGTKPKIGKDGNMTFEVDPEAAKQAAGTMYKSGAAQELAAGTTVSSNGYSFGGGSSKFASGSTASASKQYKVIQEFTAAEQGDLSIKVGDRVTITRTIDENWVEGTLKGQIGIFPRKFVAEI